MNQDRGAEHHGVLPGPHRGIVRELVPQRTEHGRALAVRRLEEGVQVRHELVPPADGVADRSRGIGPEQPRLASLRLQVRVPAEEGVVDSDLVPPRHELGVGIAEETADVRSREREARQPERRHHRDRHPEVVPVRGVVAGPDRADSLRPGEKRAGEHERSLAVATRDTLGGCRVVVHPEGVVNFPVLHPPGVNQVLLHRNLRSVEHGRLVHVVPDVQVLGASLVLVQRELTRPPVPNRRGGHVQVRGAPRPAPPVKVGASVRLFHVKVLGFRFLVNGVPAVLLHVRVHDGDHLTPPRRQVLDHPPRRGELAGVPRHVPLAVGVLDVQPQDVVRYVVSVESRVHLGDVLLVPVVPPALVVPQRERRGHPRGAREGRVLPYHRRRRGPGRDEHVHRSALRHPVRLDRLNFLTED